MGKKKKEQEWPEEPEEFVQAMLGIGEETYYNYRCSQCNYEEQVPDFVVDELAAFDELPPGVMPELECGNCGGTLKCVD
ncbi:hypothetical protein HY02_08730 [Peptococcaceae bacterium SCADC1_2_3]|nr:hypothetical protein DK28_0213180 [Peptococcaceae bacterium SCADC1_2_3]KFI37260.1 hypothetical protein HY02_08730 [Peptococcaceae bacterium SCADC1_2_3]